MEPPRFIDHRGRRILFLDLANASPRQKVEGMRAAAEVVAAEPPGSVLLLLDVTGAGLSEDAETAVEEFVARATPRVRAQALVGATGLKKLLYARAERARGAAARQSGMAPAQAAFDDLGVARDWLLDRP